MKGCSRHVGRPRGFTLVEMIAALAIMGLAMVALLEARESAVRRTVYARNLSIAQQIIREALSELDPESMEEGSVAEPCADIEGFECEVTVTMQEMTAASLDVEVGEEETQVVNYFEVKVKVTFPVMGSVQTAEVDTYYDIPIVEEQEDVEDAS